ncbi:alpha/beta hydrolase [Sporichthya sp.]|uniref:alpha/beta hydrolase n=1 Tax=Sporichthya sp. TaxID=65475 RepID=UPI001824C87D|nr:alpha/beta hydrolase [Sporichthya sp.]MBA3743479.1 alpha/beta hydrolase [Sporichthya sp.]
MHPEFRRAAAPAGLRHGQVRYGKHSDQLAEVLSPADGTGLPLVVVIHGGFWRHQYDRGHTAPQCAALAAEGYVVAALEYRRVGGGGGWPQTFTDLATGLDAVPDLLGDLVDPGRVILMGHSAGGHLALWAASRHRLPEGAPGHRSTPPPLRGVISLAGVADLGWAVAAGLGDGAVEAFVGVPPERDPEGRYVLADPARLLPTGLRAICVHGGLDEQVPVDCAAAYVAAALEAGDPAELRVLDWEEHFSLVTPGSAAWPRVVAAARDLLQG